jgi:hypothetical protein
MDVAEIRERLLRDESIRERIARRAYEIFVSRGYQGGREFEDWLQAEYEILPDLIKQEQQHIGMAQAALEPEVQAEESVSMVEPTVSATDNATKKRAAKSPAKSPAAKSPAKSPAAKTAKGTTGAKKAASTQSKAASKKTTKSPQA